MLGNKSVWIFLYFVLMALSSYGKVTRLEMVRDTIQIGRLGAISISLPKQSVCFISENVGRYDISAALIVLDSCKWKENKSITITMTDTSGALCSEMDWKDKTKNVMVKEQLSNGFMQTISDTPNGYSVLLQDSKSQIDLYCNVGDKKELEVVKEIFRDIIIIPRKFNDSTILQSRRSKKSMRIVDQLKQE